MPATKVAGSLIGVKDLGEAGQFAFFGGRYEVAGVNQVADRLQPGFARDELPFMLVKLDSVLISQVVVAN